MNIAKRLPPEFWNILKYVTNIYTFLFLRRWVECCISFPRIIRISRPRFHVRVTLVLFCSRRTPLPLPILFPRLLMLCTIPLFLITAVSMESRRVIISIMRTGSGEKSFTNFFVLTLFKTRINNFVSSSSSAQRPLSSKINQKHGRLLPNSIG